jgi:hypothetical protein
MVLIVSPATTLDTDWVPFEISAAVDTYEIPIICAYAGHDSVIRNPAALSALWPYALKTRIDNATAHAIHVPFKQTVLHDAVSQFDHTNPPKGGSLGIYSDEAYRKFGLL